ncbi:MAG: Methionyl-tRNA formyltransferase [Desulfovibrio sp.]
MGQAEPLKIVFMGTPDLAATVLETLLHWDGCRVIAAYCQPDRPAGRGMALKVPPVKVLAQSHGIPVYQPLNFKNAADVAFLHSLLPEYLAVAAYGLILPQSVLDIPARMPLNVHTSLLPKYRGAAPIQRVIMNGEGETGVTIMRMEKGLDTGPIILQEGVPIRFEDTASDLHDRLAQVGGKLLVKAIQGLEAQKLTPTPQDHENATYAAKLEKHEGALNFSRNGRDIYNVMRGVTPWPGAFAVLKREGEADLQVNFLAGNFLVENSLTGISIADVPPAKPGAILPNLIEGGLAVSCADGVYRITMLKPAGKKAMDAAAFMNGYLKGRPSPFFAAPAYPGNFA